MARRFFLAASLACLFLFFAPWGVFPCFTGPDNALADVIAYGKMPLTLHPPSGFVDSRTIADALFLESQQRAGLDGELLKLYLPDAVAQQYAEQRRDAVTRQVVLYGWPHSDHYQLDKKSLELAAQTLEGAYASYRAVPPEDLKNDDLMNETYRNAEASGISLLVNKNHGDNTITFVTLLNYPMTIPIVGETAKNSPPPVTMLTTAMATTLVLVNDCIVFVTASSIVTDNSTADHVDWVAYASGAFAEMLASANKK